MKSTTQHPTYGTIEYSEGFWTGKRSLTINDQPLKATGKATFEYQSSEVKVKGNALFGAYLIINGEKIAIAESAKWYEILFSFLIVSIGIIWGNIPAFVLIFPVVGGAIGGFICALFAVLYLYVTKSIKHIALKLISFLIFFIIALFSCHGIALGMISIIV